MPLALLSAPRLAQYGYALHWAIAATSQTMHPTPDTPEQQVFAVVAAVVDDPQDHQGLREATTAQKALLVSAVLREAGFEEAMRAQLEALPRWRWRLLDALQLGGDAALVRSFPPAPLSGALRWLAALVRRAPSHHEGRAAILESSPRSSSG